MKTTFTKDELPTIAKHVLENASMVKTDGATIVTLSGDLGAGKTTLTQEIARVLGIKENIASPTFVIMKRYGIADPLSPYDDLIHIDAYRLESSDELLRLGWEEVIADSKNLILIEWPEKVAECIPLNGICRVSLSHIEEETREVEILL